MRPDAEANSGPVWAKRDDPRRLKVGAFMRRWNIDELPQFLNVLIGEMSSWSVRVQSVPSWSTASKTPSKITMRATR